MIHELRVKRLHHLILIVCGARLFGRDYLPTSRSPVIGGSMSRLPALVIAFRTVRRATFAWSQIPLCSCCCSSWVVEGCVGRRTP